MQQTTSTGQVQPGHRISPAIAGLSAAAIACAVTLVMTTSYDNEQSSAGCRARPGVSGTIDDTVSGAHAPIFLAGDVDAQRPVLHEASSEGAIAGRNAASFPKVRKAKRAVPLSIMFTDPPLATFGTNPSGTMAVGSASYADQGQAGVEARNAGLVRIYAGPDTGIITGATLCGPGMDHIAHLFAWAIERRETADTLLQLPFYHPTFEEGLKPALRAICEAVKPPVLGDLDDLAPPGA